MIRRRVCMILWGAVLLLSPLVLAVPIEHDESVSDDLLHYALHAVYPQFKDGVFTSNRQAVEALANGDVKLVYALAKRQNSNSTTTSSARTTSTASTTTSSGTTTRTPTTTSAPTTTSSTSSPPAPPSDSSTSTTSRSSTSTSPLPSTSTTSTTPSTNPSTTPPNSPADSPTTQTTTPVTTTPAPANTGPEQPTTPPEPTTPYMTSSTSTIESVETTNGHTSTFTTVTVVVKTITPTHNPTAAQASQSQEPSLQSLGVKLSPSLTAVISLILLGNLFFGSLRILM